MRRTARTSPRSGYTAVELVVVLLLSGVVVAAALSVWRGQQRFYAAYLDRIETWLAARAAVEVLSGELRAVSPGGGDLYGWSADSVALRSFVAFAVLCAADPARGEWLTRNLSGSFGVLPRDSALVFLEGDPESESDDRWEAVHLADARRVDEVCPDGRPAGLRLRPERWLAGVRVGAPVRAFRPYVYRAYRDGRGRWWIGRRLRGGTIQPVVGPVHTPENGGLRFQALDAAGRPAGDPAGATHFRLEIRAASAAGSGVTESASTTVFLRNTDYGRRAP